MSGKKPRYKTMEVKTGVAYIAVAIVWLLWAILFPLYRLSHFLILILLSVVTFFITDRFAPKKITQVEIKDEPIITGIASVDEVLQYGTDYINEVITLNEKITSTEIKTKTDKIVELFRKMLVGVKEDPKDAKSLNKFMNYYLPTICKLLDYYATMEKQAIEGENITASKEKIGRLLDTATQAFEKQLDNMFADEALDISTDITVMENMLASQGLTEDVLDIQIKEKI